VLVDVIVGIASMTVVEGTNLDLGNLNHLVYARPLGDREGFGISECSQICALGGAKS